MIKSVFLEVPFFDIFSQRCGQMGPTHVIGRVKLYLHAKVLDLYLHSFFLAKLPFFAFSYRKGFGHIDIPMTFPW